MTRRTGLGRGLDALIRGDEQPTSDGTLYIQVELIKPNPRQPRHSFDKSELDSLASSIREHGVLQPVILSLDPGDEQGYLLIAGERRWLAAIQAGLTQVPAILRQVSEQQQLELALIENIQRTDLDPIETATAFRQLIEEFNLTHQEIADQVSKSRASVTNTLRLLNLSVNCQSALAEGSISEGHARALLSLPVHDQQDTFLNIILQRQLNVRQTEELVKNALHPSITPKTSPVLSAELRSVEERLRGRLGTKVKLNHGQNGGSIVIHYYSDEELNAIVEQIIGRE